VEIVLCHYLRRKSFFVPDVELTFFVQIFYLEFIKREIIVHFLNFLNVVNFILHFECVNVCQNEA
jgi:hypothetical protein